MSAPPPDGVGVVGAGTMGRPAAEAIAASGRRVLACDPALDAAWAQRAGVEPRTSLAALARDATVVLLYLPGPPVVEACVAGPDGLLAGAHAGLCVVDQSTVDPGTSQRMAALAAARGVGYLDAPVLGRPQKVGQWSLPVGGRAEDLARCEAVLRLVAANVFHVGASGAGNKVKLLNQLMFGAINAMTAEMMAIAERVGIAPRLLYETITASQAATVSGLFRELGARVAAGDYANATFTVDLLAKDVRLAAQMARDAGAPPLVARSVEFLDEAAQAQGLGGADTAAMWQCYRAFWRDAGRAP